METPHPISPETNTEEKQQPNRLALDDENYHWVMVNEKKSISEVRVRVKTVNGRNIYIQLK